MSLKLSFNPDIESTVYQHLHNLYESKDSALEQASLAALSEKSRATIFSSFHQQPEKLGVGYKEIDQNDFRTGLQQAVKQIAIDMFSSLETNERTEIICKIFTDRNWEIIDPTEDVPLLLKTMHNSLGDLTPELQKTLNEWVKQEKPGENRDGAKSIIIDFLKNTRYPLLTLNSSGLTSLHLKSRPPTFHKEHELGLTSFPDIFHEQRLIFRLDSLDLSNNQLERLPEEISRLVGLQVLDLSKNPLEGFPKAICQLVHLRDLILRCTHLKRLPKEIGQLVGLRALDLSDNPLECFPEEVNQLVGLQQLKLSKCQLKSIPEEIGLLVDLRILLLYNNQLNSLPNKIVQLRSLTSLILSQNQFESFPREITQLTALTTLDFSSNQLKYLPTEIGELKHLDYLELDENQLQSLPREIGKLSKLQSLNLSKNQLQSLPREIGKLSELQFLYLSTNQLQSLPREIGNLSKLQSLYLFDNPFTSLCQDTIANLCELKGLQLSANQLTLISSKQLEKTNKYLRIKTVCPKTEGA